MGGPGQPPEYGLEFFTTGIESYLSVIDHDYLSSFIREGGSVFKLVIGTYGGGKTHFLYCVRDLALRYRFVVSYVKLTPGASPFHELHRVYMAIVQGLTPPLPPERPLDEYDRGISSFLSAWYFGQAQEYKMRGLTPDEQRRHLDQLVRPGSLPSSCFGKAITSALLALHDQREDDFDTICQWLKGEGYGKHTHGKHGILQHIDKTTAFLMIRSLAQWIRLVGYSGLVVLLDEAERVPSLKSKQKEQLLTNLREVIDECGQTTFRGVMILYAVPDENFLHEGHTQVYEALNQRLATVFEETNPTGVKLSLEKVVPEPIPFLCEVGKKLANVYEIAFNCKLNEPELQSTIERTAKGAWDRHYGDIGYKRIFVQELVQALHRIGRQSTLSAV